MGEEHHTVPASSLPGTHHGGRSSTREPITLSERRRMQPPRLAKAAISAASWQLRPADRRRYRLEFYAEIHGMARAEQVRYAGSLFVHSWSLAAALAGSEPLERGEAAMTRNLRCMLHLHHYVRRYAHDADQLGSHEYMECLRCGHFRDVKAVPPFFTHS